MLLYFPENTLATVRVPYDRPYMDPIAVKQGEAARVKLVVASFMQPLAECRWSTNAS
jgi:hypothetical protein